ncbi:WD repeat-containing protein 6 [Ceratina calcarata]|uniref:tRNA (34-2'-O)-methyltransferase regulator WDR6 n=1 Tax=Ceratina calcarata TaxID=156304 RepID=A0AAJ7NBJ0_9HYME|nr:WD repeat-containing protein 6 [Ceratina calcarata]
MSSKILYTDVLALCCTDDFLFAGIGCSLHIFDVKTYAFQVKLDCLEPHIIHGIVNGPNSMLTVFGRNLFCAYTICRSIDSTAIDIVVTKQQVPDWIITAKWSTINGSNCLCLLLAHNSVCIYNPGLKTAARYNTFTCTEKCLLYAGYISVKDNGNLTIFSGTVFQEILIWEVDHTNNNEAFVSHHLKEHNGVIFSVIYDAATKLICSTSDDRTVRLWKVHPRNKNEKNITDWKETKVTLMKTMFGHTARVWRCIIKDKSLITIGEDSLMCTWSLDGKLLNKLSAHYGAAVWSIGVTNDNKTVFTGGADGAIHVFPAVNASNSVPSSKKFTCASPKYVCCLRSGKFLVFSENGTLFIFDKKRSNPQRSMYLKRYSDYCVMKVSPCHSYVCFASKTGYMAMYQENEKKLKQIFEKEMMNSKILSVHWLENNNLVICGMDGVLKMFNFTPKGLITVQAVCILPAARERWLTAAALYGGLLVCGDRSGNMHVFDLKKLTPCSEANVAESNNKPIQTFVKVHGIIGVQTFMVLLDKLVSAGRDGMLRFYELCTELNTLRALHEEKVPIDWIADNISLGSEIYIFGFQETDFVIYTYHHMYCHRVLAKIPCGGGHRSWDCLMSDDYTITFLYIRNKEIFLSDFSIGPFMPSILAVRHGYHTKEIHCMKRLLHKARHNIFISGSEDTSVRIFYAPNISEYCTPFTLAVLDGHVSSIKFVTYLDLQPNRESHKKYLIFSGGGRAQIKVWEIEINLDTYMLIRSYVSCNDITSHMLYGTDQERKKQSQESTYNAEPETRYMDIDTYHYGINYVLLFVACADGFVRIFLYDINAKTISIKVKTKCANRCITKITVLKCNEKVIALIMPTDGICRFIDFTHIVSKIKSKPEEEFQNCESSLSITGFNLHQSGINSYDIKSIANDEYLLVTGGDDNLLNIVRLKVVSLSDIQILLLSKWSSSEAHVAQITGIMFHRENTIFTAGIDQRVNIYYYNYIGSGLNARILKTIHTSVSDIKGLTSWSRQEESFLCVYGKGFEILEVPLR